MKRNKHFSHTMNLLSSSIAGGTFHPVGYYLLGGIDVDGSNTRDASDIAFDSPEDIGEGIYVDIRTDPRGSMFDIIEHIGVTKYQEAVEKAQIDQKPLPDNK